MSAVAKGTPVCLNCVFFTGVMTGHCERKVKDVGIDPVTGRTVRTGHVYAFDERGKSTFGRKCGPQGKYFKSQSDRGAS